MNKLKKIFLAGAACLSIIAPVSVTASAELIDPDLPRVVDDADLLTDEQEADLENKIQNIIDKYDFDVVLLTEDTLDGLTPMEYADDYYDYEGYGANENGDGVLLLVSMEDRDWWISTKGYGIKAFTDYGIEKAGDSFVSFLSDGDYKGGFDSFLEITEDYIKAADSGKPYDTNNTYRSQSDKMTGYVIAVGVGLGIGLIAAIIVVLIFRSQLKSVKFAENAANYEDKNSFNVTRSNDVFLYRNVSKTRRPEHNSSGGGSSTHSSSSGSSHGGGGGKF
ncbi:MAG: TPM domain-containing protein [Porcipelethomonas sp.]